MRKVGISSKAWKAMVCTDDSWETLIISKLSKKFQIRKGFIYQDERLESWAHRLKAACDLMLDPKLESMPLLSTVCFAVLSWSIQSWRAGIFSLSIVCFAFHKQFPIHFCFNCRKGPFFEYRLTLCVQLYWFWDLWVTATQTLVNFLELVNYTLSVRTVFSCK